LDDLLSALPPGVNAVFRFDSREQQYDTFFRGQPPFLSTFSSANRLDGLFIRNTSADAVTLSWEQTAAGAS